MLNYPYLVLMKVNKGCYSHPQALPRQIRVWRALVTLEKSHNLQPAEVWGSASCGHHGAFLTSPKLYALQDFAFLGVLYRIPPTEEVGYILLAEMLWAPYLPDAQNIRLLIITIGQAIKINVIIVMTVTVMMTI